MRILVTNDDGAFATGIQHLVAVAREFGDVKVVAPDGERSACGHAMTMRVPLRVKPVSVFDGVEAYAVNGMPVDCVNMGLHLCWPEGCDLVLSGINHGPNLGYDVTYSGTVAGAMEGVINGIHSVSVSVAPLVSGQELRFDTVERWLRENWQAVTTPLSHDLTFVNVNVPNTDYSELKGQRVVPMGRRVYKEKFERRADPWGVDYYWQGGAVIEEGEQPGTDFGAVTEGYVSITPVTIDWTQHGALDDLAGRVTSCRS